MDRSQRLDKLFYLRLWLEIEQIDCLRGVTEFKLNQCPINMYLPSITFTVRMLNVI